MTKLTERFLSLDVFRGMTVCFMIIVNTPGAGATPFAPLLHAHWNGFTPTDLVFPSFLFAVGNAMSFSLGRHTTDRAFLTKVIKRTILIFLLGFLMYWFPFFTHNEAGQLELSSISQTRIMGVLQRIALCYFFASLITRYLSTRSVILTSVALLAAYWIILLLFPGTTDPYDMVSNAGSRLDIFLFGPDHLYHGEGLAFDPEGLLSTMPAIVNVTAGFLAGKQIRERGAGYQVITELFLVGTLLVFLSLCWNPLFPINKKLWTGSFVLLTVGLDLCLIGALIYITELRKWNPLSWTRFFIVFGKNPLFIYLLSELLLITISEINVQPNRNVYRWINDVLFQALIPGPLGSMLFAIAFMLTCWSAGWLLDRKKVYIRV